MYFWFINLYKVFEKWSKIKSMAKLFLLSWSNKGKKANLSNISSNLHNKLLKSSIALKIKKLIFFYNIDCSSFNCRTSKNRKVISIKSIIKKNDWLCYWPNNNALYKRSLDMGKTCWYRPRFCSYYYGYLRPKFSS